MRQPPVSTADVFRTRRLSGSCPPAPHAAPHAGSASARWRGSGTAGRKARLPVSRSTVLSELRRAGCPIAQESAVVVGIDDWAITRGHHYGTIMVDLEKRCPIELVDGRNTAGVVPRLARHPAIEVISRDRAGAYADAARKAAPDAQQVADRWHLMANMCEAVERLLLRHSSKLREAARLVSAGSSGPNLTTAGASSRHYAASSRRSTRRVAWRSGSSASFTARISRASTAGCPGYGPAECPSCGASRQRERTKPWEAGNGRRENGRPRTVHVPARSEPRDR